MFTCQVEGSSHSFSTRVTSWNNTNWSRAGLSALTGGMSHVRVLGSCCVSECAASLSQKVWLERSIFKLLLWKSKEGDLHWPVALLNVKGKFFEWKLNQCSLLV